MAKSPSVDTTGKNELDKLQNKFDEYHQQIKDLSIDELNTAPALNQEPQTKLSSTERDKVKEIYLKPKVTIGSKEKFNEKFRESYEFDKQYVCFEAENNEIIGETITIWTKPYPGLPAEEWEVPTNKPVWGPRYLANQITNCKYHRFTMQNNLIGNDHMGSYHGYMIAKNTINRLNAHPSTTKRQFSMRNNVF